MQSLIKNIFLYNVSTIVNSAIPFLMMPVLTHYLAPTDYGIVTMITTTLSILTIVIGLNLHYTISVFYFKVDTHILNQYITSSIVISSVNFFILAFILIFTGRYFADLTKLSFSILFIIVFLSFLQSIVNLTMTLLQVEQKVYTFNLVMILSTFLNAALSLFLIVLQNWKWEGRLIGISLSIIGPAALSVYFIKLQFNKAGTPLKSDLISYQNMKEALRIGIPMVVYSFSGLLMCFVDRYIIAIFSNITDLGIYSVAYSIGMLTSIYASSVNRAWFPHLCSRMSKNDSGNDYKLIRAVYIVSLSIIAVGIVLLIATPFLFKYVIGKEYSSATKLIPWISFAYVFEGLSTILGGFYLYAKKSYLLSKITAISAFINIIVTVVLVKNKGILGAAQATFITYFIFFVLSYVLSRRCANLPWLGALRINSMGRH